MITGYRRWLPCAGLVGGALAHAILIVVLIPDRFGSSTFESEQRNVSTGASPGQHEQPETSAVAAPPYHGSSAPAPRRGTGAQVDNGVVRSIFAPPPMELPIAPPDPAPALPDPPPVPSLPAALPTPSIFTLPEPPPAPAPTQHAPSPPPELDGAHAPLPEQSSASDATGGNPVSDTGAASKPE